VAVSFVYLLRLDETSGYLDGLLPAFLLRGAGIGLVMSATSYAVVTAAPLTKVGLASGTLTMARNLGTAMGVALFGTVYSQYVADALGTYLATASVIPADAYAGIYSALEHFAPFDGSIEHAVAVRLIVDGFVHIAFSGVVVTSLATVAAVFIRPGVRAAQAAKVAPTDALPVVEA
jgi:hypothetical protein